MTLVFQEEQAHLSLAVASEMLIVEAGAPGHLLPSWLLCQSLMAIGHNRASLLRLYASMQFGVYLASNFHDKFPGSLSASTI